MITTTENIQTKVDRGVASHIDVGSGKPLIFLHGLFGGLSNWDNVIKKFAHQYRVLVPQLPLLELDIRKANLDSLVDYVREFKNSLGIKSATLVGNSLGGHVALLYTLRNPHRVSSLVLVGSSGLYENSFGNSFPKRGDYGYVRNKVADIFHNKTVVTEDLVNDVYETTRSISNSLKIVHYAKSAQRNNLADYLSLIQVPTQIIWGANDPVTPPEVGLRFNKAIKGSELHLIPECGHVPMMETPEVFNGLLESFLKRTLQD